MAGAEIRLLGKMTVLGRSGRPVEVPLRKAQALLAFLALNPDQPHSRQRLAGLLWGNLGEEQARRSLTKGLTALRRSIGGEAEAIFGADTQNIWLQSDAIRIDVEALRSLAAEAEDSTVETALSLCRGELLEDFVLKEAAFNDWLVAERTVVRKLQADTLGRLTEACLEDGNAEAATALAERLVSLDSLDEAAHRLLMRAHERAGRRSAALAQYRACKEVLARELGVEPEAKTRAQYEALKASEGASSTPSPTETELGASTSSHFEKPSIAVLAFTNMSGDPEQEYFSDGVTEDIITELSRFRSLSVLARHSSFAFKGKKVTARQVSEELGVQYVLEGSIQREEGRLRVTAQLVDAVGGNHLWAEHYDQEAQDLFKVRDSLVGSIVATLAQRLEDIGVERARRKGTKNLTAHDHYLRGRESIFRASPDLNRESRKWFQRAIELDPGYAAAHANLAWTYLWEFYFMWSASPEDALNCGMDCALRAVALDQADNFAHGALACACVYRGQHERAKKEIEKAAKLNPHDADTLTLMGSILRYTGKAEECIDKVRAAIDLTPFAPDWYLSDLSSAYYLVGRYSDATATILQMEFPLLTNLGFLAASYAQLGQDHDASEAMRQFHSRAQHEMLNYPGKDIQAWCKFWSIGKAYKNQDDFDHILDGLCKAGLVNGDDSKAGIATVEMIGKVGGVEIPAIAVLAFDNLSGDPDQDYFSDGMTEDIITELSRFRSLSVMARHSSFALRGKPVSARQAGEMLGVQYILEGSIQRDAGRLRVAAQLIDAADEQHLWAETYDRKLEDLFEVRDSLVSSIVATLAQRIEGIGLERARRKGTENLTAYDLFLRGRELQHRVTKDLNQESRKALERAIELDPGYAAAFAELTWAHLHDFLLMWSPSPERSLELGLESAQRAVALDPSESGAHAALASACLYNGEHDRARSEIEKAAKLNPYDTDVLVLIGTVLRFLGQAEEGIEKIENAIRLNPFGPDWYLWDLCQAYYAAGRYEEAVSTVRTMESPNCDAYGTLAASHAQLGQPDKAHQAMRRCHEKAQAEMHEYPGDDLRAWRKFWSNGSAYKNQADLDHLLDGLCTAGLVSGMAEEAEAENAEAIGSADPIDRPSIAVLVFANMSGDSEQEYFSDGVTEDIITELSRFRSLSVLARHSSFAFKGKALAPHQVGQELGMQYVVEGSVQKSSNQLRVTAQLIDAADGNHLWAEHYDRELDDLFDVRDELVGSIVATLAQRLEGIGAERARRKGTENLTAYDHFLRGRELQFRATPEGNRESRKWLERAIELDPGYAAAYANLAWTHLRDFLLMWSGSPEQSLEHGLDCAQRAVTLDQSDGFAHGALACACAYTGRHDRAEREIGIAFRLNPYDTDTLALMGTVLRYLGRPDEAVEKVAYAIRLGPFPPDWYLWDLGNSYYLVGRYDEAITTVRGMESPVLECVGVLAAAYAQTGLNHDAQHTMRRFHEMARAEMPDYPGHDLKAWRNYWSNGKAYKNQADLDHLLDGLCKAGLMSEEEDAAGIETTEIAGKAGPAENPTIAVLPFENMSGDPGQDYFSDGITEDIITELSRFRSLTVMARHSTFAFKGQAPTPCRVSKELGVQYVLEGSIQKEDGRVRATAQLIDVATVGHLWAEHYDRELEDIFKVRDEVVQNIVAALAVRVEQIGRKQARRKDTDSLTAYDYLLRGRPYFEPMTSEADREARRNFERAIELDPGYASAYTHLAWTYLEEAMFSWSKEPGKALQHALRNAQKAVALDETDCYAHAALACAHLYGRQHERAEKEFEKAIGLNPNDPKTLVLMGHLLACCGRPDEALEWIGKALRLNPHAPDWYFRHLGLTEFSARRYEGAIARLDAIQAPPPEVCGVLAASYALLGRDEEAHRTMVKFQEVAKEDMGAYPGDEPQGWSAYWSKALPYKNQSDLEHLFDGLRKAGLRIGDGPDGPAEVAGPKAPDSSDKPSIAVLPLTNMSDDPEQAYFSDGITEDIITELSRFKSLQVVARSSTFVYRDQSVNVKDTGRALGASYLLEGSLRKVGKWLRLTAQLIDVDSGNHIWAERYDRELEDIFAIQDELVHAIVTKLAGQLATAETERSRRRRPENLTAYDYYLRGLQGYRQYSKESILGAAKVLEKAVDLDPGHAKAQALLAWCISASAWWTSLGNYKPHTDRALSLARKAIELEPNESFCKLLLGMIHLHCQELEQARFQLESALTLNPHDPLTRAGYATYVLYAGRPQTALDHLDELKEFEPFPPNWYWEARGTALYLLSRYEDAVAAWGQMTTLNYWDLGYLAACYGQLGQKQKAQACWAEMTEAIPDPMLRMREDFEYFEQQADVNHWLEGLRKAGLTE